MSRNKDWSKKEDNILRSLWMEGRAAAEIGRAMHRSKNSIIGRVNRTMLQRSEEASTECHDGLELNIELKDTKREQCMYPFGDVQSGMTFCGRRVQEGKSYCPHHYKVCTKEYIRNSKV